MATIPSTSALGLMGSASPIGNALTAAQAGLGLYGTLSSYFSKKDAEAAYNRQVNAMNTRRNYYEQQYVPQMQQDIAERNVLRRGQGSFTPGYQSGISRNAQNQRG